MTSTQETVIRLSCFAVVFGVMAVWELLAPRRPLGVRKSRRWISNLGLVALNSVVVWWLLPLTALATAALASDRGWGLLNQWTAPEWLRFLVAVAGLDFAIYLQHVLFHAVPGLWRFHMVHHVDLDFDLTTGLRFHTIEILLSTLLKMLLVLSLGPPVLAVLTFEVLLNATSIFNHSNARLPPWLDRAMRLFVVTPDMHRVHHSTDRSEANSNFGFNLPWWDFLLGTYRSQPAAGHEEMPIGTLHVRDEQRADRLLSMLALPFLSGTGDYPFSGRNKADPP